MNDSVKKDCSIIFYEGRVGIVETIINLATVLAEKNYAITIYSRKNQLFVPEEDEFPDEFTASIVYFDPPSSFLLGRWLWKFLLLVKLGSLTHLIDLIIFFFQIRLQKFKNKRISKNSKELLIGIDINGLLVSYFESVLTGNKNAVYLSLELKREAIFTKFDKFRLFLLRRAYRKVKCVLVQDEDRFATLGKFNKYQHPTVFFIPNSPFKLEQPKTNSGNYFRHLFDLDKKTFPFLVAQTGMVNDKVFCRELAASFGKIDLRYALIYHERRQRNSDDSYIRELRELNSTNLFLSLNPLPYKDIDKIYASLDIGIAFYRDINENFAQISKASGKLAQYLRHGKPVLMNDLDSLNNLNEKYDFGLNIKNPADHLEIKRALEQIINNYDYYSRNALICFNKEFDFRIKTVPFLEYLATNVN